MVIVAHGRSLFPDHLLGRGVTTVNIAQVIGLTMLPLLTGPIVGAFADAGAAPGAAPSDAVKAKDAKPSSAKEQA